MSIVPISQREDYVVFTTSKGDIFFDCLFESWSDKSRVVSPFELVSI